jgi:hypothetical protein
MICNVIVHVHIYVIVFYVPENGLEEPKHAGASVVYTVVCLMPSKCIWLGFDK